MGHRTSTGVTVLPAPRVDTSQATELVVSSRRHGTSSGGGTYTKGPGLV